MVNRIEQIALIGTFTAFSWLAMQAVHELGHMLGAAATGGQATAVVLHPCTISRTDVSPNPHPLLVAWAGPVAGVAVPLLAFLAARMGRVPGVFLFQFFAGFCLIANGAYIGVGSFEGIGDTGDMLRHGSQQWLLILFGLVTVPLGLWLWNGLGPNFGLGPAKGAVSRSAVIASVVLLGILVVVELVIGSR